MTEVKRLKLKVCLVGDEESGKTALIHHFVEPPFSEAYIRTIGAGVSRKTLTVKKPDGRGRVELDLTVLDILGNVQFLRTSKEAYFPGTKGLVAVCNAAHRKTLDDLPRWIEGVQDVAGVIPVAILVNRSGLRGHSDVTKADVKRVADTYRAPYYFTSEKTGAHVAGMFRRLVETILMASTTKAPAASRFPSPSPELLRVNLDHARESAQAAFRMLNGVAGERAKSRVGTRTSESDQGTAERLLQGRTHIDEVMRALEPGSTPASDTLAKPLSLGAVVFAVEEMLNVVSELDPNNKFFDANNARAPAHIAGHLRKARGFIDASLEGIGDTSTPP